MWKKLKFSQRYEKSQDGTKSPWYERYEKFKEGTKSLAFEYPHNLESSAYILLLIAWSMSFVCVHSNFSAGLHFRDIAGFSDNDRPMTSYLGGAPVGPKVSLMRYLKREITFEVVQPM